MFSGGVHRTFGLGGTALSAGSSSRRHIDPADIAYANDKRRLGWGWQAIGQQLGINAQNLKEQCEGLTSGSERSSPPPAKPRSLPAWFLALQAIDAGAQRPREIATAMDFDVPTADRLVKGLKRCGMLSGSASLDGWTITSAGRETLENAKAGGAVRATPPRFGRATATPIGIQFGSRQADALVALARGAADRHEMARALDISPDNAGVLRQQLCRKGLISKGWTLSEHGVAEAAALMEAKGG